MCDLSLCSDDKYSDEDEKEVVSPEPSIGLKLVCGVRERMHLYIYDLL